MARPKSARPSYRYHVSGQAIVTLGGRDFYLGEYNSPKSNARYLELLKIYQKNGLSIPDHVPTQTEGDWDNRQFAWQTILEFACRYHVYRASTATVD